MQSVCFKVRFKEATSNNIRTRHERRVWAVQSNHAERVDAEVKAHKSIIMNLNLRESYREARLFRTPSSAQSFHNSELQRRCPRPIYFLWREHRQAHPRDFNHWWHITISNDITQNVLCNHLSLLLHWRWTMETKVMLCYIHPSKENKKIVSPLTESLTATK